MENIENKIDEKFIKQATELALGAEIVPDGVMGLAKKLQKAEETKHDTK